MAKKKSWGVPDWRDAAAYPKKLNHDQWRWEFTRRRGDYRQHWEEAERVPEWLRHIRRGANGRLLLDPCRPAAELDQSDLQLVPKPTAKARLTWEFDLLAPIPSQLREAERVLRGLQKKAPKVRAARKPKKRGGYIWARYLRVLDARASGAKFPAIGTEVRGARNYNEAQALAHQDYTRARELQQHFPPA